MSVKPFIAEFHDIGKLVDRYALQKKGIQTKNHTFHEFDFSQLGIEPPSSPSWHALSSDSTKSLKKKSRDYLPDVFLVNIADNLAASVSRSFNYTFEKVKKEGRFVEEGIHLLWNPGFYEKEKKLGRRWASITNKEELIQMFKFMDECLTPEELFCRFNDYLKLTPEDKSAPINIVSLFTHLELVGKVYRVLKKYSKVTEDEKGNIFLEYNGEKVDQIKDAIGGRLNEKDRGKWVYRLVFCRLSFLQSLIRLPDLNIFVKRMELVKGFCENTRFKDYVLFQTDDFICLFLPLETELKLKELLEPFLSAGFIIDYYEMEAELNLLTSSFQRTYEKFKSFSVNRHLKVYEKRLNPELPQKIHPPLCESCQIQPGNEYIKKNQVKPGYSNIREYLCTTCAQIRYMGEPAREYAEWEENKLKAAWLKISLDQDQLLRTIERLFNEYVEIVLAREKEYVEIFLTEKKELCTNFEEIKTGLKESFRPLAVQMDFIKDYKMFLQAFSKSMFGIRDQHGNKIFNTESFLFPIKDYLEFGIFKVYSGQELQLVVEKFCSLLREYFPQCLEDSPIKLSISLANVKYPYQEHWRFLSSPVDTINLQEPKGAKFCIDLTQYELIKKKLKLGGRRLSYFLHRLAKIDLETKSEIAVMLEILENRKKHPALLDLMQHSISAREILGYYKMMYMETIQ